MTFQQIDPLLTNAKLCAQSANDTTKSVEDRAVLAQLATAWATIAQAQATHNSWISPPAWHK